jgi:mono/diheme cytochrome c family protein
MKRAWIAGLFSISIGFGGCARTVSSAPTPPVYGSAIVEVSGGKQTAAVGGRLEQPVVVQVNDDQGNAVTGAMVSFHGANGVTFEPAGGSTDSSGQFTTIVSLGGMAGRYQIVAGTPTKAQKAAELKIVEIALGYQEVLGRELSEQYCARCHNPESTPERVSNYDNLEAKPHSFTEGDTLNKMSGPDLLAIISYGGPALNKSALMPPYGYTLSKSDVEALIAYIRMVSDPPYQIPGMLYAKK